MGGERKAQAAAHLGDSHAKGWLRVVLGEYLEGLRRGTGQVARIMADDPHHLFAGIKRKPPLYRLPVPGGGLDVVGAQGVGPPAIREEGDRGAGAGPEEPPDLVSLPDADLGHIREAGLALHPAIPGDDDKGILGDDVSVLVVGVLLLLHLGDGGAALFAVFLAQLHQLGADLVPETRFRGENEVNAFSLGPLFCQLLENGQNLQFGQAVELDLQDGVGLDVVQVKAIHQPLGGISLPLGLSNDLDGFV